MAQTLLGGGRPGCPVDRIFFSLPHIQVPEKENIKDRIGSALRRPPGVVGSGLICEEKAQANEIIQVWIGVSRNM